MYIIRLWIKHQAQFNELQGDKDGLFIKNIHTEKHLIQVNCRKSFSQSCFCYAM